MKKWDGGEKIKTGGKMFKIITYTIKASDVDCQTLQGQRSRDKQQLVDLTRKLKRSEDTFIQKLKDLNKDIESKLRIIDTKEFSMPEMREPEKQKLSIELKEKELILKEQFTPENERIKSKIKELETVSISIPDSDNYYTVNIKHKEITTTKWIDIRVKQDQAVSPLSNINGSFTINDERIEIFFQSNRPKLDGAEFSKLSYPKVENPTGSKLIIYIGEIESN